MELRQGQEVELIVPFGYREPGERAVVVHACANLVLVDFDRADRYGTRQEILDWFLLRSVDEE